MCAMLIDCWEKHMQYPDLRPHVIDESTVVYGDVNEFGVGKKADLILVEDKSAGISLIQDLQRTGLNVRAYNPGSADKMQRLNIVSPIIRRGLMYVPESMNNPGCARDWADPLIAQVCAFPEVRHDDLVDALTQALRVLRDMGFLTVDFFSSDDEDYADVKPRRVNPYAS